VTFPISRIDASLNHGNVSKETNTSRVSMNSQKPCGETFVTSTGEVRVPSATDFIQVLLDQQLDFMDLTWLEPIVHCEFDCRFDPEFGLAVGVLHMDVQSRFFS
jgi:hypothetical protein